MAVFRKELSASCRNHILRYPTIEGRTNKHRKNKHREARIKLRYELLEPRNLLAGDLLVDRTASYHDTAALSVSSASTREVAYGNSGQVSSYNEVSPGWFQTIVDEAADPNVVGSVSAQGVGINDTTFSNDSNVRRWLVRFTEDALTNIISVGQTAQLLAGSTGIDFRVIRGLGLPGQIEVETREPDQGLIEAAYDANPNISYFILDSLVVSQSLPNDPLVSQQHGLENTGLDASGAAAGIVDADIDAADAFSLTTGRRDVVVAVVDSGVDYTHPDLYENVWINAGEIPDAIARQLVDIDGDQVISFVDLNHSVNRSRNLAQDLNGNGFIDAGDLLNDPQWSDGVDTDGNGFVDDLSGYDFHNNDPDPFDDSGHGTHVSGIIAASGDNGIGIAGVAYSTTLMPLKFLSSGDLGATANATRAINYATMMKTRFETGVRVINNSWGGDVFNRGLFEAVQATASADILLVAGAGNGNSNRNGIDIDSNPFYPASFDVDNLISVTASGRSDELAPFANFGAQDVDIAAPGVSILSTLPGGQYGPRHGTSMAAAFVSGAAALQYADVPYATFAEVRDSIFGSVDPLASPTDRSRVATGGRLNANKMLRLDTIAPRVSLSLNDEFAFQGSRPTTIKLTVSDDRPIDASINFGDTPALIIVTRKNVPDEPIELAPLNLVVSEDGRRIVATYEFAPPGGSWNKADNGTYEISVPNLVDNADNSGFDATLMTTALSSVQAKKFSSSNDSIFIDVNFDGLVDFADVIELDENDAIRIRFNTGEGKFSEDEILIPVLSPIAGFAFADLESNGKMDLIVAKVESTEIDIYRDFVTDSFASKEVIPYWNPNEGPQEFFFPLDLTFGDVDNDNDLDLIIPVLSDRIVTLFNDGAATFENAVGITTPQVNVDNELLGVNIKDFSNIGRILSNIVVVGDLDGDGNLDLARSSINNFLSLAPESSSLDVFLGDGSGRFEYETSLTSLETIYPEDLEIFDANGDGQNELLGKPLGSGDGFLYELAVTGSLQERPLPLSNVEWNTGHSAAADIDLDGDIDIVRLIGFFDDISQLGFFDVQWLENDGLGNYIERYLVTDLSIDYVGSQLKVADIDSDGFLEVILLDSISLSQDIVITVRPTISVSPKFDVNTTPLSVLPIVNQPFDDQLVPLRPVAREFTLREAILEANKDAGLDAIQIASGSYSFDESDFKTNVRFKAPFTSNPNFLVASGSQFDIELFDTSENFAISSVSPPSLGGVVALKSQNSLSFFWEAPAYSRSSNAFLVTVVDGDTGLTSTVDVELTFFSDQVISGDIEIIGNGADTTTITRSVPLGVFEIGSDVSASFSDVTIRGGFTDFGGGVLNRGNAFFSSVHITQNQATQQGGGLANLGTAILDRSTVSNNSSRSDGGGIYNQGSLEIVSSTISTNTAQVGAGIAHNQPSDTPGVTASIVQSTITGNQAVFRGGGLIGAEAEPVIPNSPQPTIDIRNSIVAGNSAGQEGMNIEGTVTVDSNSLIGLGDDPSLQPDPLLGPLQNNGGTIPTHLPLVGSPVIDAGEVANAPSSDQRGAIRVLDGDADGIVSIDLGAVEFSDFTITSTLDSVDANLADDLGLDAEGNATLRAAIQQANASAGADTITLPLGTFLLTIQGRDEDSAISGDLDITDELTIVGQGRGVTIIDAGQIDRVFDVFPGAKLTLRDLTIRGGETSTSNSSGDVGGGARTAGELVLQRVEMLENQAEDGGGALAIVSGGVAIIRDSILSGNSVTGTTLDAGGGAIRNEGQLTIESSTLSANTAAARAGGVLNFGNANVTSSTIHSNVSASGGGWLQSAGRVTINTSTVSSNIASDGEGGGVLLVSGVLTIRSSTIAENQAATIGGGVHRSAGTLRLGTTLIGKNSAPQGADLSGTAESLGLNLIRDADAVLGIIDGVNGDIVGIPLAQLGLGPLQDNGGSTLTHAILLGSRALDAGGTNGLESRDQRGGIRNRGNVDIGAYELLADTIFVRSTVDRADEVNDACSSGTCSLREAVLVANQNATPITIVLEPGIYELSIADEQVGDDENDAATGDLDLLSAMRIIGRNADDTVIDANGVSRVVHNFGFDVEISNVTITGGDTSSITPAFALRRSDGGGILNEGGLTLRNTTVIGNQSSENGGGIATLDELSLTDSSIVANSATLQGGGLYIVGAIAAILNSSILRNVASNEGGGIYQIDGSTTVNRSTIAFNVGKTGGGVFGESPDIRFVNVTLSSNRATDSIGGASSDGGFLNFNSSTIYGNLAPTIGGLDASRPAALTLGNSIVAGNIATEITDGVGFFVSAGFNLFGDQGDSQFPAAQLFPLSTNDLVGNTQSTIDPIVGVLVELTDNRGETMTHALAAGSPAIDAGSTLESVDQRGLPRSFDGDGNGSEISDIGAFELIVDNTPPVLTLGSFGRFISPGSAVHEIEVVYRDNTRINLATIDDNDLTLVTPIVNSTTGRKIELPTRVVDVFDDAINGEVRVTYEVVAPGGSWDPSDEGTYALLPGNNQVVDINGNAVASIATSFEIAISGIQFPSVDSVRVASNSDPLRPDGEVTIDITGAEFFDFDVNGSIEFYVDTDGDRLVNPNVDVILAQFPSSGALPPVFTLSLADLNLSSARDRDVTILAAARGTDTDSGAVDILGVPAVAMFNVIELNGPTATLNAQDLVSSTNDNAYDFSVTYRDETAVASSSLGEGDIRVDGPNGFSALATFVGLDAAENSERRIATYRITPPGGTLSLDDNGFYDVTLLAGQVSDINGIVSAERRLGGFTFEFVIPVNVSGTITGNIFDDADGNGVRASDEVHLASQRAYLDLNHDGRFQPGEPNSLSDTDGDYQINYNEIPSGRYAVLIESDRNVTFPSVTDFSTLRLIQSDQRLGLTVATGLLDQNASDDLVIANYNAGLVMIRTNDGFGGFAGTGQELAVPAGPIFVASIDLDGALGDDVIVVSQLSNSVSVFLNDGAGQFTDRVDVPLAKIGSNAPAPSTLVSGDFDGDGDLDLAVAYRDSVVSIMLNRGLSRTEVLAGEPLFSTPLSLDVRSPVVGQDNLITSLAVEDFDDDSHLDLAVAFSTPMKVQIHFGSGASNVATAADLFPTNSEFNLTSIPISLVTGDFKGDTKPDLAIVTAATDRSRTGSVLLLRNQGSRTFVMDSQVIDANASLASIVAADLDGDQRLELITAASATRNVAVFSKAQSDDFAAENSIPIAQVPVTFQNTVATSDIDSDNLVDLLVSDTNGLSILHNAKGGHVVDLLDNLTITGRNFGTQQVFSSDLVLNGELEAVRLSDLAQAALSVLTRVDIRGTGNNSIVLDAALIASLTPNQTLLVITDAGDGIEFGDGWVFAGSSVVDGQRERIFTNAGASVRLVGPLDWTNPLITGDVNGNGEVTAGDALDIIFALNQPELRDNTGLLVDSSTVSQSLFRFLDTNQDGRSTAADALFVINVLFLQTFQATGEAESQILSSDIIKKNDAPVERTSEPHEETEISVPDVELLKLAETPTLAHQTSVLTDSAMDERDDRADRERDVDETLATVWDWID